jgi:hypothetical protein
MIIISLILIGIFTRLIPHVPNFTPIIAIALFSGAYLNKKYALWLPITLLVISDIIIGLHDVIAFTWTSILLITIIGSLMRKKRTLSRTAFATLGSSILFFILSNFGVWLTGWYPRTFSGLIQAYTMAIPFFRISLIANLVYVTVLFGVYQLIVNRIKDSNKQSVLLLN